MVDNGLAEDRLRGGRPAQPVAAPTTPRSPTIAKGLADRYEGTKTGLSLPSTRVDAFNIDLANELTRNGRRSGLTFAPEGGSERMRKVINKMVTEEDLIRTVATAYGNGWRQVKLYFMCGLPTETDEDVLQIAELGAPGDRGRPRGQRHAATSAAPCRSAASCPSRTRRSSGPRSSTTRPPTPGCTSCATRSAPTASTARRSASATTTASPASSKDCSRAATAASARSSSRCGATAAGSTAGASTSPSTRWMAAAADGAGRPARRRRLVHHARARAHRGAALGPPRLRPRQGLALGGLAGLALRGRGRGLPLDAVLRLRRLRPDGHRDPDRPHRRDPARHAGAAGARRGPRAPSRRGER